MLSDYYCYDCEEYFEYKKPYGVENFPEKTKCIKCEGLNTKRKITFNSIIPDHMKSVNQR